MFQYDLLQFTTIYYAIGWCIMHAYTHTHTHTHTHLGYVIVKNHVLPQFTLIYHI